MASDTEYALGRVKAAAATIFAYDPTIFSVGVGYTRKDRLGFIASRDLSALGLRDEPPKLPRSFEDFPIVVAPNEGRPAPLASVSGYGQLTGPLKERQVHRPLYCGVEVQNFDHEYYKGSARNGRLNEGSLGCMVRLPDEDRVALLSNNHILAGLNRATKGDAIYQCASATPDPSRLAATLHSYVKLQPSPVTASFQSNTAAMNKVDAAIAVLDPKVKGIQEFLGCNQLVPPSGKGDAQLRDPVHKSGAGSGPTSGLVTQVGVVVQVLYGTQIYWFEDSIVLQTEEDDAEGQNVIAPFSQVGDSGSIVVRANGDVLGLLYAGTHRQSYAAPINTVLSELKCELIIRGSTD